MTPELISQIIGGIVFVFVFVSMQTKNIKLIMLCQIGCNSFGAVSYILLGGLSGCGIFLVATAQSVILFFLRKYEKEPPLWLNIIFVVAYIACSLITFKTRTDIFPLVAAILCAIGISQKKPTYYRLIMLSNASTWIAYDLVVAAYTMLATHAFTVVSAVWGLIRFDVLKRGEEKKSI